jgi:hypothetical protein
MGFENVFQTISISGKYLTRDQSGKKVIVKEDGSIREFTVGKWVIDNKPSPIQLAHCGKSNIVALDFDGPKGEELFLKAIQLDPNCRYVARSLGKQGGHLIYTDKNLDILKETIQNPNGINIEGLDVQMGQKLILLATEGNRTKKLITPPIKSYNELTNMPPVIQLLVVNYYLKTLRETQKLNQQTDLSAHKDSKLYYIVKEAIDSGKYNHKFFNIITPKSWKEQLTIEEDGKIIGKKHKDAPYHPDNLVENAHMYLVSLATVLAMDPSIDADLFRKAIDYINNLFSDPLNDKRKDSIVNYILSGKSQISGKPVWNYDPDWKKKGFIYTDHFGYSHEVFAYNNNGSVAYLDHNHINNIIEEFNTATALIDKIKSVTKNYMIKKDQILQKTRYVKIINDPTISFGVHEMEDGYYFNIYKRTEELEILLNPEIHTNPKTPEVTLKLLENAMGKYRLYNFFLPFIKRKFTKWEFSPLILVLYGPPHSGKSVIPTAILAPFAKGRSVKLTPEILTEKYNDWQINKDIVFIDEIHNSRSDHLKTIIQTMNTISGNNVLTGIRAMHRSVSSEEYPNTITIIVTTNQVVQLSTEPQDRRLVILRSKRKASEALGMTDDEIFDAIQKETKDFAYYLATQVQELPRSKYITNEWLKDEDYEDFQESALPLSIVITSAIDKMNWDRFVKAMTELRKTEEDIIRSSWYNPKYKNIQIRLYNTNEHDASYSSLLHNTNLDHSKLMKDLKVIRNTKVKVVDSIKGHRHNNRKTVAEFSLEAIPEEIREKIMGNTNSDNVDPIEL